MLERLAPEQYDTLPDIPEPAETTALVGHAALGDELAAAYRAGKLHHGLLFAGPRGIGKATLAFRLANHLLTYPEAPGAPPTLAAPNPASPVFRMVASGSHPGVLHLTRPFDDKRKVFRTGITVDEIRRVARFLSMSSHDGGWRIVIVDPADDLNRAAANALLKNLEEPPRRTLFVLIAHQPGRLLPTIRSRCRLVRFQPLGADDLAAVLAAAGDGSDAAGGDVASRARGSAREAFLLTRYGGLEIADAMEEAVRAGRFDPVRAYRVADAVTGRDRAVQFAIFNDRLLDLLGGAAADAAGRGDGRTAAMLAQAWQDAEAAIAESEAYNLDRREHVVSLLHAAHAALSAAR